MKFIDEYRQGDIAKKLAEQIAAATDRPLKFMEVCGGHTHTIFKYGIEDLIAAERRDDPRSRMSGMRYSARSSR